MLLKIVLVVEPIALAHKRGIRRTPALRAEVPLTIWYLSGIATVERNRGKPVKIVILSVIRFCCRLMLFKVYSHERAA